MKRSKRNLKQPHRKTREKVSYLRPQKPVFLSPPTYTQQEIRSWRVRYILSGTPPVALVYTCTQIAQLLGFMALTTTTSEYFCNQFKLKRLCVWGPVATAGTSVSVQLKWADNPQGTTGLAEPPDPVGDTSVSYDRPAYACLVPPKGNSFADFWQPIASSNSNQYVVLTAPVGTILDFFFNFVIDDVGGTTQGPTIVAGTAGTIYHKILTNSGTVLTPVSPLNGI